MSTPNPFQQPDKGERFAPRDHPEWVGRLFIIYPDSVSQHMGKGPNGQPEPYEAVEADVAIVDLINPETGQPKVLSGVRIGGKSLVPQIKKHCGGGMVLGRLTQGQSSAEKSGAYFLAEYTDADVQMATQYINTHPRNAFTQPTAQAAPAPAPAQQQAWGQQATPQYDVWQHTQAAPAPAVQAAPAGPPQGQWGAPAPAPAAPVQASLPGAPYQPPAASPQAAPAPTAPASASAPQQWGAPQAATPAPAAPQPAPTALDPGLVAFLRSKGVDNPEGLTPDNAQLLANHYQQQAQQPPF